MEGYLLCCFGSELYFKLCIRTIKNIREFDKTRNICILTDNPTSLEIVNVENCTIVFFDYKKHLHASIDSNNEWNKYGFIPKIFQSLYSPFEKTMYLDVDMIFKQNFTFIWDLFDTSNQCILAGGLTDSTGRSPSHWHWGSIDTVMHNTGIKLQALFSTLIVYNKKFTSMLLKHIDTILDNLTKWDVKSYFRNGYPDEIIYSILCGMESMKISESIHDFLLNQEMCDVVNKTDF